MDTTTVSLILGCLCAGLIWWFMRGLTRRFSGRLARENGEQAKERAMTQARDEAPWEHTDAVYKRLLHLRIASFALCVLAAIILYFHMGTVLAVAIAGLGCILQFTAYHIRTQHMLAVRKAAAADAENAGKATTPSKHES